MNYDRQLTWIKKTPFSSTFLLVSFTSVANPVAINPIISINRGTLRAPATEAMCRINTPQIGSERSWRYLLKSSFHKKITTMRYATTSVHTCRCKKAKYYISCIT